MNLAWPVLAGASLLTLASCAADAGRSPLMQRVSGGSMTGGELRARVRSLAPRFSGELEEMADEVAGRTDDPRVRLAATRFKSEAVPQLQLALFQPDPVAALIDTWAFLVQLQTVLEAVAPGPRLGQAGERFSRMQAELEALWRGLTGKTDVSQARGIVHDWASRNPIHDSLATRTSTAPVLAKLMQREETGALGSAARLVEQTEDFAARLDLATASLPKQARWQSEYLIRDLLADRDLLLDVREGASALVTREREALAESLRGERLAAQAYVTAERRAATEELDRIGRGWIELVFDRAEGLARRLLFRLSALLALLCAASFVVLLLRRRAAGARDSQTPAAGERRART